MTPPTQSSGSPRKVLANGLRCGSSCTIPEFNPLAARNSAPLLLRESAPPVLVVRVTIRARPGAGSSFITLFASLFANSMAPSPPAMMPSALLPSHDQTTFQFCPAAITPGIAVDAGGGAGSGGAALRFAGGAPAREKG